MARVATPRRSKSVETWLHTVFSNSPSAAAMSRFTLTPFNTMPLLSHSFRSSFLVASMAALMTVATSADAGIISGQRQMSA